MAFNDCALLLETRSHLTESAVDFRPEYFASPKELGDIFFSSLIETPEEQQRLVFFTPFKAPIEREKIEVYPDQERFHVAIKKAFEKPDSEIIGHGDVPEFSFYKGDIYLKGYYFSQYVAPDRPVPPHKIEDITRHQPWFEWIPREKKYVLRTEGIQRRLIQHMLDGRAKIILYRGTAQAEWDFFKTKMKEMSPAQQRKKAAGFLYRSDIKGVFFTPQIEYAKTFSRGMIVAIELSREQIMSLAEQNKIYIGIEGDAVEISIFDPELIMKFQDLYTLEK